MAQQVKFTARRMSDDLSTPIQKEIERSNLLEYEEMMAQEAQYGHGFYKQHHNLHQAQAEHPTTKPSGSKAFIEAIQPNESQTQKEPQANVKVAPHLTLTPAELKRAREEAVEKYLPRGFLSKGLSGEQAEISELVEAFIRMGVNEYKLVDRQINYDRRLNRANLNYIEKKVNKPSVKELKVIAKNFGNMELKESREEALRDLNIAMKLAKNGSDFDVKKMNKEEKDFINNIIKPILNEAKEKNLNVSGEKADFKALDNLYVKQKKSNIQKELKHYKSQTLSI
jgi:hypothetical protein